MSDTDTLGHVADTHLWSHLFVFNFLMPRHVWTREDMPRYSLGHALGHSRGRNFFKKKSAVLKL